MRRDSNGGRRRLFGAFAVSAVLLVPLAAFGAPALARTTGAASAQYQYRVQICHLTGSKKHPAHTITVSSAAVAAHLRHGDHLGPCTGNETPRPKHNNGHHDNTNNGHHDNNNGNANNNDNGKGKGH